MELLQDCKLHVIFSPFLSRSRYVDIVLPLYDNFQLHVDNALSSGHHQLPPTYVLSSDIVNE